MSVVRRFAALAAALALALGPASVGSAVAAPPPSAVGDAYPLPADPLLLEDHALTIAAPGVLANDTPTNGTCVVAFGSAGPNGDVVGDAGGDGSFTFTPTADFNGTATVTITVTPVNDKPLLSLGLTCDLSGVSVAEDSGPFSDSAHCLDIDWGGGETQNVAVGGWHVSTTHPELFSSAPSISTYQTNKGRLAFTPAANANGVATVTVTVKDNGGTANGGSDTSDPVNFTVTINSVDDAPTASPDSFIVLKDTTLNVGAPGVLLNDHDIDSPTLSAVKITGTTHGVLVLAADGSFSYTPNIGYVGLDAFLYQASDGSKTSPNQTVTLTVTAIPPVPTPTPVPTATPEPTPTPEPTLGEGLESFVPDATDTAPPTMAPSLAPGETAPPTPSPSLQPGATPAPGDASGGGGIPLPVLLVLVLLVLLVAFGAALYVPNWLREHGAGPPDRG